MDIIAGKTYLLPEDQRLRSQPLAPGSTGHYFGRDLLVFPTGNSYQHPGEDRYYELRVAMGQPYVDDIGGFYRRAQDLKEVA